MASGALRSNTESALTFREGDLGSADVQALLDFHFAEMRKTSPPEACHVLPIEGLRDPSVTFWSVRDESGLLGVGALKELALEHGEIKSMRTASVHLRKGVAHAVVYHIIAEAKRRGYRRLSLEAGSMAAFEPARRLYLASGFSYCEPFSR